LGFRGPGDDAFFSATEKEPFVASDWKILLAGYRAICHELYQKLAATDAKPVLSEALDGGLPEWRQRAGRTAYSHRRMSLNGTLEGVGSGGSFPRVF
jgi:hypothetical protein